MEINDIIYHPKFGTGKITLCSHEFWNRNLELCAVVSFPRKVRKFIISNGIKNGMEVVDSNVTCSIRKWRRKNKALLKMIENGLIEAMKTPL